MALNKHQIFASNDLKESFVEIPEWGGKVKIRALSVQEQLDYDAFLSKDPTDIDMALHLIIVACIDDKGERLFDEKDDKDLRLLKAKSGKNLFKIVEAILKLNKQSPEDLDATAKNS